MHAVCLVHVDNLCDMVLSARGKQKLDKICESFCSSSQVLEPFLDDNDLTEDVRAFLCIALEDLATRQGLRMLQKVPWIFTTNAPLFRQLVHDAPSYGPSAAGMLSRLVDALILDCAI